MNCVVTIVQGCHSQKHTIKQTQKYSTLLLANRFALFFLLWREINIVLVQTSTTILLFCSWRTCSTEQGYSYFRQSKVKVSSLLFMLCCNLHSFILLAPFKVFMHTWSIYNFEQFCGHLIDVIIITTLVKFRLSHLAVVCPHARRA